MREAGGEYLKPLRAGVRREDHGSFIPLTFFLTTRSVG
jgi:hypothetical protein